MVLKVDSQGKQMFDKPKWLLVFVLLLAGLIGNHYYSEVSMPLRTVTWLAIVGAAGWVASTTQKGKKIVAFFYESRLELRKVIWPTREEVTQTTLAVAAMVVVLALLLWGIDSVLVWLIGWLTGQRG